MVNGKLAEWDNGLAILLRVINFEVRPKIESDHGC